jgi:hypothetical protein
MTRIWSSRHPTSSNSRSATPSSPPLGGALAGHREISPPTGHPLRNPGPDDPLPAIGLADPPRQSAAGSPSRAFVMSTPPSECAACRSRRCRTWRQSFLDGAVVIDPRPARRATRRSLPASPRCARPGGTVEEVFLLFSAASPGHRATGDLGVRRGTAWLGACHAVLAWCCWRAVELYVATTGTDPP